MYERWLARQIERALGSTARWGACRTIMLTGGRLLLVLLVAAAGAGVARVRLAGMAMSESTALLANGRCNEI